MLVKMQCPQCGGQMEIDSSRQSVFCSFCGTKIENVPERLHIQGDVTVHQNVNVQGTVLHKADRSGDPNLYIDFQCLHPAVGMVVRIAATGQKSHFIGGQQMSYHLQKGENLIVLKIGKINYNRKVYINDNNDPVRIQAMWNGRAHIHIDQPPYTPPQAAAGAAPAGTKPVRSWQSILGFVLALTMLGCLPAALFCILDLNLKDERLAHGLSVAGLIISAFSAFAIIAGLLNGNLTIK